MIGAKPFDIPKREVWEAFKRVKANQGAAGVDGQSIEEFEVRLADNLYKLWNWLSSGSYMPPSVRRVDIPKANGGTRPLGKVTSTGRRCIRRFVGSTPSSSGGTTQVQAPAATAARCSELAGAGDPFIAGSVCPLATSLWSRPNTGSRMS